MKRAWKLAKRVSSVITVLGSPFAAYQLVKQYVSLIDDVRTAVKVAAVSIITALTAPVSPAPTVLQFPSDSLNVRYRIMDAMTTTTANGALETQAMLRPVVTVAAPYKFANETQVNVLPVTVVKATAAFDMIGTCSPD